MYEVYKGVQTKNKYVVGQDIFGNWCVRINEKEIVPCGQTKEDVMKYLHKREEIIWVSTEQ